MDERERVMLIKHLLKNVVDFVATYDRYWGGVKIFGVVDIRSRSIDKSPYAKIYFLEDGRCAVEHIKRISPTIEERIKEKINRIEKEVTKFVQSYEY